jgi:hypothetical protein
VPENQGQRVTHRRGDEEFPEGTRVRVVSLNRTGTVLPPNSLLRRTELIEVDLDSPQRGVVQATPDDLVRLTP